MNKEGALYVENEMRSKLSENRKKNNQPPSVVASSFVSVLKGKKRNMHAVLCLV